MKRRRMGEQGWREVMERFGGSGQTVSEFCKCEGVNASSFYAWRSRLNSARLSAPTSKRSGPSDSPPAPPGFVDLGLMGEHRTAGEGALAFRLELGGGVVLHWVRH